jgi:NAD(P)-dependent dehydrogenase (short-subunit alcohol dehydrogenase family)
MTPPSFEKAEAMPTALITGASAGLGRSLTTALVARGWHVIITARGEERLNSVAEQLKSSAHPPGRDEPITPNVIALAGDIADPDHRARLVATIGPTGSLDLLINNASTLGPAQPGHTPLRRLAALSPAALTEVLTVNVIAPFALTAALLPALDRAAGIVVDISSDAAVQHYPEWGGYGASKAALDHLTRTFGVENLDIACYAVDPGDMRTDMQQSAFPGEDISDRRSPDEVVPELLALITNRPPSGRYRAIDLLDSSDSGASAITAVLAS